MKRGQGVTEYLMTYGWALMAVVVVLAILIWLGIFGGAQVNEYCDLADGSLFCESVKATEGEFRITLRNTRPTDIAVCDIICDSRPADSSSRVPPPGSPAYSNCEASGVRILSGNSKKLLASANPAGPSFCTHDGNTPLEIGEQYRGSIYIIFTEVGEGSSGNARVAVGELLTTIQP
jgi:hypothetical protein